MKRPTTKKIAIVTGASRGIGAATALMLGQQGYDVCVNYATNKDKAEKIATLIKQAGVNALAINANLADEKEIIKMFEYIDQEWGPVTALVNNAGINGGVCEVENIDLDTLQTVFATNVYATFICCREAIKRMKKNGGGAIVNLSSEAAKFGGTKLAHYASSKAAINTFTIALAREVASYKIRVNAVSPGVIDTDIHLNSSPQRIQTLMNSLPMGRMGSADEVAKTIEWLLSENASYLSGAIIPVTGAR